MTCNKIIIQTTLIAIVESQGRRMQLRSLLASIVLTGLTLVGEPSFAASPEPAYRVLQGAGVCLPCGAQSHVVIDSRDTLQSLHAELKQKCHDAKAPDAWRQSILDLRVDFRDESIVTLYGMIGTGGKPSLHVSGPKNGVLTAAIAWDTGPPPHVPIASAACFTFAVRKSVVDRVEAPGAPRSIKPRSQ